MRQLWCGDKNGMKMMEMVLNYLQAVDLGDCLAVMLVLSVPMTLCLLFWFRASCVATKGRLIATIALLSVIGWGLAVGGCLSGLMLDNLVGMLVAFLFGWAYPWMIGLPIMLMSLLLYGLFVLRRKLRCRTANPEKPIAMPAKAVLVLHVLAIVLYATFLSVKPGAIWKDWSGKQYRTTIVDGIVHVQIREAGDVSDVRSGASCYHRYDIVPVSDDELLLKSSDIGDQYLRKVDGKWEWQQEKLQ